MASNIWKESGPKILELMAQHTDYKLIVTGHSLGAGTACLLTVQLYVEEVFAKDDRIVECFAFAPPPTFWPCDEDGDDGTTSAGRPSRSLPQSTSKHIGPIRVAARNTVAFIHDNDVVPFLSVSAVRRMIRLLDSIDNETERLWFWQRWKILYEFDDIPKPISRSVMQAEKDLLTEEEDATATDDGERRGAATKAAAPSSTTKDCPMIIPARRIVWIKHNFAGRFRAYNCDPEKVARQNIYFVPDMLSDHMPEQYENALDAVLDD